MAETEDKGQASGLEVELAVPAIGTVEQPAAQPQAEPVERTDDDEHEGEGAPPTSEEERSARAERRRRTRERNRQEQAETRELIQKQGEALEWMFGQVQQLSAHTQGGVLSQAEETYRKSRADMKAAYESGDAEKVADATEALNIARLNLDAIKHQRQRQPQRPRPEGQERQQPQAQPNPYQSEWLSRNDWYRDPDKREDAAIAHAISQTLEAEGYAPNDPSLFTELDRRLKKRGIGGTASQHTPGKVIVASGQRQSLNGGKSKTVLGPRVQNIAERFGYDLNDPATKAKVGKMFRNQATK